MIRPINLFRLLLTEIKVLPVLTIDDESKAIPICTALQRAGYTAVEITMRTKAALGSINLAKQSLPDMHIAAGTIVTAEQLRESKSAGADFVVSPGITTGLVKTADELDIPILPGVATASEIQKGIELGLNCFKLFPAEAIGGKALLNAFNGPYADITFCATGGLDLNNYTGYLSQPNVACVAGSWMLSKTAMIEANWFDFEECARSTISKLE